VLDLPASTGITCLQSLELLSEKYRVTCYVLGDMYHTILYDPHRRCVFDKWGNLLQVAFKRQYFSVYRGNYGGHQNTLLSACLLFPHSVLAWYVRKRYRFEPNNRYRQLLIVHPEVEPSLSQNVFRLEELDVFRAIPGNYQLILSFNLLTRNNFSAPAIEAGLKNLTACLSEGGLLILGDSTSFLALQRQKGSLVLRLHEGDLRKILDGRLTPESLNRLSARLSSLITSID
jgi:hypothetical protein